MVDPCSGGVDSALRSFPITGTSRRFKTHCASSTSRGRQGCSALRASAGSRAGSTPITLQILALISASVALIGRSMRTTPLCLTRPGQAKAGMSCVSVIVRVVDMSQRGRVLGEHEHGHAHAAIKVGRGLGRCLSPSHGRASLSSGQWARSWVARGGPAKVKSLWPTGRTPTFTSGSRMGPLDRFREIISGGHGRDNVG